MNVDTFTLTNMFMSVRFGWCHIPSIKATEFSAQYCSPLLLDNDSEEHPLSVAGSSVLIHYRNKHIQLSSAHQFENLNRDFDEARIVEVVGTQGFIVPPKSGSRLQKQIPALENMRDVVALTYEPPENSPLPRRFLKLWPEQFVPMEPENTKQIFAHYFVGFPSQVVGYELDAEGTALSHLRSKWIRLHLERNDRPMKVIPNRAYVSCLDSFKDLKIDPDGISGAPVFVVYQTMDDQCHFGFCGIITHANNDGTCAIYEADPIKRFLDRI